MFTVHLQRSQNCTILDIHGEFTEVVVRQFQQQIDALFKERTSAVVNLEQCTYISSAALRVLLTLQQTIRLAGNQFCLAQPSPFIHHILEITRISSTIPTYATLEEALQYCSENR